MCPAVTSLVQKRSRTFVKPLKAYKGTVIGTETVLAKEESAYRRTSVQETPVNTTVCMGQPLRQSHSTGSQLYD